MLLSGVVLFLLLDNVSARVNCTHGDIDFGDAYCVERYREGSICAQDGFCSNPFRSGCLHKVLDASGVEYGDVIPIRTCNTDDDEEAQQRGECLTGNYDEIRILSQDWEAPMLTAWIMQIVLSEVLGVPTTLETSMADSSMNFYDPQMRFAYSNDTYVSVSCLDGMVDLSYVFETPCLVDQSKFLIFFPSLLFCQPIEL